MKYRFEVSHSDSLIQARVFGTTNEARIRELWAAIVEACEAANCYDILGVSELDEPFSVLDAFNHHEIFSEVGIGLKHRIAWVNKGAEAQEILKFTETILVNRSKLNGGLFETVDEAKSWLRDKEGSQS